MILALGQDSRHRVPAPRARRRVRTRRDRRRVRLARDRLPRRVRGRRHGAERAHGDGRRRARQEGRASHRRLAAQHRRPRAPPKHDVATLRQAAPLVLRRRRAPRAAGARRRRSASPASARSSAACPPTEAVYEAGRCLSCGNCFECDGCLGACPEDAVIKLGPGHRYRFDYDRCTGCGGVLRAVPGARDRDGRGARLRCARRSTATRRRPRSPTG